MRASRQPVPHSFASGSYYGNMARIIAGGPLIVSSVADADALMDKVRRSDAAIPELASRAVRRPA